MFEWRNVRSGEVFVTEEAATAEEMPDVSATESGMSHSGMSEYPHVVHTDSGKNAADRRKSAGVEK